MRKDSREGKEARSRETEVGDEHRKTRANVYDTHTRQVDKRGQDDWRETSRHRAEERKDSRSAHQEEESTMLATEGIS